MPFLIDEAFDYNDNIFQNRALCRDFPQPAKATQETIQDHVVVAGGGAGNGVFYVSPVRVQALTGTIILTKVQDGIDAPYGAAGITPTVVTLDETGAFIEDVNVDFTVAGFTTGGFVKVNSANDVSNNVKWNGYYRISSIVNGGGTNARLNLNATDIVGTPGDHTAQTVDLRPVDAGTAFTVTGTAGVTGLLVAGQRFTRDLYMLILRVTVSFSGVRTVTASMQIGAVTLKHLHDPAGNLDFDTTADTIVDDTPNDLFDLGFRVGGGAFVLDAAVGANNGLKIITAIDDSGGTNNRLTVVENLTTSANDAAAKMIPYNSMTTEAVEVNFTATGNQIQRTDIVSWASLGYFPGDYVVITDAVDGGNNSTFQILALFTTAQNDDTLVVDGTIIDEAGDFINITSFFVPERFGDMRFTVAEGNSESANTSADFFSGEEPPFEDVNGDFNTEWFWQAPGLIFGAGVNDQIFGMFRTAYNNSSALYRITTSAADGYVDSSNFSNQPNDFPLQLLTNQNNQGFFVCMNGAHVRGRIRVANSVDEPWYLGWGELQAAKGQHPYPMLVGASTSLTTLPFTDITQNHAAYFDPRRQSGSSLSSCVFQLVDGTYTEVLHSNGTTYNTNLNKNTWFTPYTNGRAITGISGVPEYWQVMIQRLRQGLGSTYQTLPIELFSDVPQLAAYIKLFGVVYITGDGNATENTYVIDGVTHVVVQNIFRTGRSNFCAYALD